MIGIEAFSYSCILRHFIIQRTHPLLFRIHRPSYKNWKRSYSQNRRYTWIGFRSRTCIQELYRWEYWVYFSQHIETCICL